MYLENKDSGQSNVEIRVTPAWINLIRFCITECPHGEISIRITNAEPTILINFRRSIRFDKPDTIPSKIDFSSDGKC